MLLHFSHGTGNYGLTSRPNSGSLGGSAAKFDRFDGVVWFLGDEISSVPKGTATVAVQYREDTAETSGETNFSGVHKEAVHPRLQCSSLGESISLVARKLSCRRALAG